MKKWLILLSISVLFLLSASSFLSFQNFGYHSASAVSQIVPQNANLATSSVQAYVPITLSNKQPVATTSGFQQMIVFNPSAYSAYESSDLGNIRFCANSSCSSQLHSWLESCNPSCKTSAASATVWINLGSLTVPAKGSLKIYMAFYPISTNFDGKFWGESSQLTTSYGQYDNGVNVFSVYNNFAGTTLDSHISNVSKAVLKQDNGLEIQDISACSSTFYIMTSYSESSPFVYEASITAQNSDNSPNFQEGLVIDSNTPTSFDSGDFPGGTNYMSRMADFSSGVFQIFDGGSQISATSTPVSYPYTSVESFNQNSTHIQAEDNGQTLSVSTSSLSNGYLGFYEYTGFISGCTSGDQVLIHWIEARAYPPNGVMPSAGIGILVPTGFVGIKNQVTILEFDITNSGACVPAGLNFVQCFSIQQNFYIYNPKLNELVVWAQNLVYIGQDSSGNDFASAQYEVWNASTTPDYTLLACRAIGLLSGCSVTKSQFQAITLPLTFTLTTTVSGDTISFKNLGKTFTYQNRWVSGPIDQSNSPPQLDIVGEIENSCGNPSCADQAVFSMTYSSTHGNVKSWVDVAGKWSVISPQADQVLTCGSPCNGYSSGTQTAETSVNLRWSPSTNNLESFINDQSVINDQGISFIPPA